MLILANVFGLLLGSIIFLLRRNWGYLFSNKEEVVKYVASMMPLLATSALLDAILCALSGSSPRTNQTIGVIESNR